MLSSHQYGFNYLYENDLEELRSDITQKEFLKEARKPHIIPSSWFFTTGTVSNMDV